MMRRSTSRRWAAGLLVGVALTACTSSDGASEEAAAAPAECLDAADTTRDGVDGTPVWALFCPGEERHTVPAEVPSEALTTHLELLDGLHGLEAEGVAPGERCGEAGSGRTYEVQIGYADGRAVTLVGSTDPGCPGRLPGGGLVGGPDALGVYGLLMTAFGRQYAGGFADSPGQVPFACPEDPRDPDSVDLDGASASLDTGYVLGVRSPMVMPLTAVRGIVCTWPWGIAEPGTRELTAEEAERVRIGLHAIYGGMVDCQESPEPTHTAVVEDRTGTRRAVTVLDSNCSTVVRSDRDGFGQGYGLGFPWLDR